MIFVPKEVQFSDNFEALADKLAEAVALFLKILEQPTRINTDVARMKEIEHEADTITHNIYRDLHTTFVAPLDREDIHALANEMDNIADIIESTAIKMETYKIVAPLPDLHRLAVLLQRSISHVREAIYALRKRKSQGEKILQLCIEINSLENEADQILRQAMARLFEEKRDPIKLIKDKELMEDIEEATDICEDISNILEGIILKYG
ncbi:MAG: DUF47 family protein [Syntrophales bacterium]|nr:DUF47 family protein [Syntrophales bacterium]